MKMISDQERREVADKLYKAANVGGAKTLKSELAKALNIKLEAYTPECSYGMILRGLADLIDRPICRIVHDENRDCDVCTNCSTSFELAEFDYADANVFEGYSYCPKCGAEVVEDD